MLHFFRTHQKYFFVIVTFVIVISFSFFGTYGAIDPTGYRDQTAFVAVDGTAVKRSELEELVTFISTDSDDKLLFGGSWGPNFLNDGVLYKNFLQTGLALQLAQAYRADLEPDYIPRWEKEKRFQFYRHPQADFISLDAAWSYFSPSTRSNLETLLESSDPLDSSPFEARVQLFLAERKIPASSLRQILRFQEKQYNWVTPDPRLQTIDLSMFGYHTFEDWFGPRFTYLAGEFIINAAKIAEKKGYRVSNEEALADLIRNSEVSFRQNSKNPNLGVANSAEYFNEQLRRLNMDPTTAAKVWRQVMLFRQLFQDPADAIFVDTFSFEKVNGFMNETASGDLYQLSPEFRLGNGEDLRKLEAYLASVSKRDEKAPLMPPKAYLSVEEVKKGTPELVQKKYSIEVASLDARQLEGRISIRETWNWEGEEKNWALLKKEFPEIALKPSKTREERLTALDNLDETTRTRVDIYARSKIIQEHPDWIENSLAQAERKPQNLIIRQKGGKAPLLGVKDPQTLMKELDGATIGEEFTYTPDQQRYYSIKVIERSPQFELSTYAEAIRGGVLEELAKSKITDEQFNKTVAAIKAEAKKGGAIPSEKDFTNETAATLRFYPYVKAVKEELQATPTSADRWVRSSNASKSVENQFQMEKIDYSASRSSPDERFLSSDLVTLAVGGWTEINTPPNGDLSFFHLIAKSSDPDDGVGEKITQVRKLLSDAVQKSITTQLLEQFKEKNSLSLSYLNTTPELSPSSEEASSDLQHDG